MLSIMNKKKQDQKKLQEQFEVFWTWVFIIVIFVVVGWIGSTIFGGIFGFAKGLFSSEAKDFCSTAYEVTSAKTDYAAKQAFKTCVKNY